MSVMDEATYLPEFFIVNPLSYVLLISLRHDIYTVVRKKPEYERFKHSLDFCNYYKISIKLYLMHYWSPFTMMMNHDAIRGIKIHN